MATYSTFFSSGLLAPRIVRCKTPVFPPSSMGIPTSPVDPIDCSTLGQPGQINPIPKVQETQTNGESAKVRRRRSSITVGASPMALIKSPVRNAGAALQRTGLLSPSRHRAASVSMNDAFENNSLFGRLRSGSIGNTTNPPVRPRRAIRRPVPLAPPPSVPLPALPSSPTTKCGTSLLPPAMLVPTARAPLAERSSSTDNVGNIFPLQSPLLGSDYAKMVFESSHAFGGSLDEATDEVMKET